MKRILLLLFGIIPMLATAQSNKVLTLLNLKNTPVSKTFQPIGYMDGDKVKLEVIRVTDLNTDSAFSGLKFEIDRGGKIIANVIDKKEVAILIKLLTKLKEQATVDPSYIDLTFTSNLQFKRTNDNLLKSWGYTILLNRLLPDTDYNFGVAGLTELFNKLNIANAYMQDSN